MKWILLLLAFLSVLPTGLWARSNGAPRDACPNLMPQHGVQGGPNNGFFVMSDVIDSGTYEPGEAYKVTLVGVNVEFAGFFIQARTGDDLNSVAPIVGTWTLLDNQAQTVACNGPNSAVTHTASSLKRELNFTWTAPDSDVGQIHFIYSVVIAFSNIIVRLNATEQQVDTNVSAPSLECVDICPVAGAGWVSALRPYVNGTTVTLIWEPNQGTGGTNYEIQYRLRNTDSDPTFNIPFITADTVEDVTTYTIQGLLQPDTDYEVRVCLVEEPDNCGDCLLCVQTGNDPDDVITPGDDDNGDDDNGDDDNGDDDNGDDDNTNDESGGTVTSGRSFMSLILVAVLSIKITTALLM